MAKLSLIARDKKRTKLEAKYRTKRTELKELAREAYIRGDIPWEIHKVLQELPKNSHLNRIRKRCRLCWRPISVYRKFGLCRLCLRKFAMRGFIPGLVKASW